VPAAGSWITSPGLGFIRRTRQSIKGRGVKYCSALDFFSAAFVSSRPSERLPRPSSRAENQSSLSMAVVRALRLAGLRSLRLLSYPYPCTPCAPTSRVRRAGPVLTFHCLCKQGKQAEGKHNVCLAAFIAPAHTGIADYAGAFDSAAGIDIDEHIASFEADMATTQR
jgi:hypothetical protein